MFDLGFKKYGTNHSFRHGKPAAWALVWALPAARTDQIWLWGERSCTRKLHAPARRGPPQSPGPGHLSQDLPPGRPLPTLPHQLHSLRLFLLLGISNTTNTLFTRCAYLANLPRFPSSGLFLKTLRLLYFLNTQLFYLLCFAVSVKLSLNSVRFFFPQLQLFLIYTLHRCFSLSLSHTHHPH